jgi:hypothetical protein
VILVGQQRESELVLVVELLDCLDLIR